MKRLLFVCSRNRWRSPTAEHIFSQWENLECDSAGLAPDAEVHLSSEQIDWADMIFVMEARHRKKIHDRFAFNLESTRLIVLGIPDKFSFMDPSLIAILEEKVPPYLR